MVAEAVEKLKHTWPNTPQNWCRPFSDKRFIEMWCPFHRGRLVGLSVYEPWPGEFWIQYCAEGCWNVGQQIEGLLTRQQPHVTSYVTTNGLTIVYEARWSLGGL
jgi:hypothetical protein